jgi:hypothetical protein
MEVRKKSSMKPKGQEKEKPKGRDVGCSATEATSEHE